MPRKSFKDSTAHLTKFFSDEDATSKAQAAHLAHEPHAAHNVCEPDPASSDSAKYYRLHLRLKPEYREYLSRVSWEAHQSVTQYLNNLIAKDMSEHESDIDI